MSGIDTALTEAQDQLGAGDPMAALRTLRHTVDLLDPGDDGSPLAAWLGVFAGVTDALGGAEGTELVPRIRAVAAAPGDARGLYDLAYELFEHGLYDAAAHLLDRCDRLAPDEPAVLSELVLCLHELFRHREAADRLARSPVADSNPLCGYLHGFSALLSGDVETARRRAASVARSAEGGEVVHLAAELAGMVQRADAVGAVEDLASEHSLTAWHAAINGTVLLHESPFGWDEPMRGRYAYVTDSVGLMREGVERLVAVLDAVDRRPGRVIAPPDRMSRVLAGAVAERLGVPVLPWAGGSTEPGLVTCWDLATVDDAVAAGLADHRPDQILFAHVTQWVQPFPYSPDVTTLLGQMVVHPWLGTAMVRDPDTGAPTHPAPDGRNDEELIAELLDAEVTDPSETSLERVVAVAGALAVPPPDQRGGLHRSDGRRRRQRAGSPVASSRFA